MEPADYNSREIGFFGQFGIFIALIGAGLAVGSILSVVIWIGMTGRSLGTMAEDMFKPQYYYEAITVQAVSTLFYFFIPTVIFAAICYRRPGRFLGFSRRATAVQVGIVLVILLLTFPLSAALSELNQVIPLPAHLATKFKGWETSRAAEEGALININSFSKYIFSMILIGLLPGLFEETVFRAGLQNILTRWFRGPVLAIVLSSILFSLVHLSYYGFLVRFALGVILGLIFYLSGNLWLSVLFHFLYNGLQVTALYISQQYPQAMKDQSSIESRFPVWAGVVALVVIIFLLAQFRKASRQQLAVAGESGTGTGFETNNRTLSS